MKKLPVPQAQEPRVPSPVGSSLKPAGEAPAAPGRTCRVALKDFQRYQAAQNALRAFVQQQVAPVMARQQELSERVDMLIELFASKYGLKEGDQIEAEKP